VNEEAEAGSTIEILSAFAMDPDEVSVEMIFSGTNSIRNFASVEVVTTTDFSKQFMITIHEDKVSYEYFNREYFFTVVLKDDI
jgi:hypothetical protein